MKLQVLDNQYMAFIVGCMVAIVVGACASNVSRPPETVREAPSGQPAGLEEVVVSADALRSGNGAAGHARRGGWRRWRACVRRNPARHAD